MKGFTRRYVLFLANYVKVLLHIKREQFSNLPSISDLNKVFYVNCSKL